MSERENTFAAGRTFDDVVKWAKDARAYRAYAREGWDQIRRNCCEMSMYDIRDAEQRARWCEARVRKEADAMRASREQGRIRREA